MKLIIDIPEEMISLIKDKSVECFNIIHYGQVLDAIYNGTPIPDNATNGDVIKAMFPNTQTRENDSDFIEYTLDGIVGTCVEKNWWNSPYQKGGKE